MVDEKFQIEFDGKELHSTGKRDGFCSIEAADQMVLLYLNNGRYIKICHCEKEHLFSLTLICNASEYEHGYFHPTAGDIDKISCKTIKEVNENGLPTLLETDKRTPVR